MIIHINREWRVVSDPLQWIVQRRRSVNGKDRWESLAFYRDLERAVLWLAERQIRLLGGECGPEALTPLHQALDTLGNEIREALQTIKTEAEALKAIKAASAGDLNHQEADQ